MLLFPLITQKVVVEEASTKHLGAQGVPPFLLQLAIAPTALNYGIDNGLGIWKQAPKIASPRKQAIDSGRKLETVKTLGKKCERGSDRNILNISIWIDSLPPHFAVMAEPLDRIKNIRTHRILEII